VFVFFGVLDFRAADSLHPLAGNFNSGDGLPASPRRI